MSTSALLLLSLAIGASQDGAEEIPLPLRVHAAIARGVEQLEAQQLPDGNWPGQEEPHPGGMTSLCCYALVKSGVRVRDESLARGLAALADFPSSSTYSTSVHLLLLESLRDHARHRAAAQRDLDALLGWQTEGLWAYPSGTADLSNTQFALLGMLAAHRMGLAVRNDALEDCAKAVLRLQAPEGGLRYTGDHDATGGMTAASLAGLAVIAEIGKGKPVERLLDKRADEWRAAGEWLGAKLALDRNPYGELGWTPTFLYPYLWAVERWGGLAGQERIAGRDWYSEGAEFLVGQQRNDGAWGRDLSDVCFALLFLRRATVTPGGELEELAAKAAALGRPEERHPAPEVPRLTDWLACGPWGGGANDDLLSEPPFKPARVKPRERAELARLEWRRLTLKADDWTELEELTGKSGDRLLWALAARVGFTDESGNEEPMRAILWPQLEDGWQVWFDGVLVSSERRMQAPIEESVQVALELRPDVEHTLLILVEDWRGASAFGARLTDREGRALPASVHVDPDFSERGRR